MKRPRKPNEPRKPRLSKLGEKKDESSRLDRKFVDQIHKQFELASRIGRILACLAPALRAQSVSEELLKTSERGGKDFRRFAEILETEAAEYQAQTQRNQKTRVFTQEDLRELERRLKGLYAAKAREMFQIKRMWNDRAVLAKFSRNSEAQTQAISNIIEMRHASGPAYRSLFLTAYKFLLGKKFKPAVIESNELARAKN